MLSVAEIMTRERYSLAAEEMARNMMDAQTVEGVDAFLPQLRQALPRRLPQKAKGDVEGGPAPALD